MTPGTEQRKLAAIMFTDMVGYSTLAQRSEALALELLEEHRRLLRSLFPRFNGTEIKTIGDAFLVEFGSALEAAQCAIEIQRTLAKRNPDAPAERRIQVRIGIHIGDVIHREGDVLGDGVNIASRIEQVAGPNGICISMDVERQIRHALEASLVKLPAAELKNIQVPMDLFRIVLPWEKASEEAQTPKSQVRSGQSFTSAPTRARWTTALVVLAVILAVGVGWWFYRFRSRPPTAAPAPAAPMKSLAVLPFENLSSDPENEYVSDGLTRHLIITLQNVSGLQVQGQASSFHFKGKRESFQRIGEQLQVSYLLEGSVSKAGNKLRVNADLINASDGFQLWATNYDRDLGDLLLLQSEIAQAVASEIRVRLTPEDRGRLARARPVHPDAVDAYLRGMQQWWRWTDEGTMNALGYLRRAVEIEPDYAQAQAGLALAYISASTFIGLLAPTNVLQGEEAAEKAIKLDPMLADAYVARGYARDQYDWDWRGAEMDFTNALALSPHSSLAADGYATFLVPRERFDEAKAVARKALELDPHSPGLYHDVAIPYWGAGQFDQAIPLFRKALDLERDFHGSRLFLGWCYLCAGRSTNALAEFQTLVQLAPDWPWSRAALGHALALAGRRAEALQLLAELGQLRQKRYVSRGADALVCLGLGQTNVTLNHLEQAYKERDPWVYWLRINHSFAPLRNEPRFKDLLKRVENGGREPYPSRVTLGSANASPRIRSLAVKPLDDFSGDTNQAYLSDGMTEALCIALGNISALRVPGRASVMRFKGSQKSIQEMAQELNVDAIVEGSVLRGGNQIRVTAKLIEAATDRQLWGTSYNRDLSDFFVMLDEVARAIAAEIQVRLTPEDEARLRRARVVNPGAIDAYWQGMHHYWQWSPEGLTNALGFFQKAIDIEPDYAPAHAGLALAYVGVSGWLGLWFPTNVIQATNAAQRAIQLDPTLADAYVARGYAKMNYNWDWAGAEEDFLKAINLSLRPSLALDAYNNWLVPQGRLVEAVAVLTNALALDPLSPALHHDLGWTYWVAGQFTQAMWHCSMALKLDTNFYQSLRIIGWCYLATGRTNEALHAFMTNVQQVPDSQPDQAALGYAYGVTGRRPEAMQVLADLKELRQKRYVSRLRPALVHLGLGQTNEALKRLEEAYEERDGWISTMVTLPPLAPLRNERRFQELLKKLGHEELMKKLRHEK